MAPLPFVVPVGVAGSQESYQNFEDTFPGGGNNHHQSTLQWTDAFDREAEMSKCLADAKPNIIEYENQQEVSGFFYLPDDRAL